jgi:hypothetical protein
MLPTKDGLDYVLGTPQEFSVRPKSPFADDVRHFLAQLSSRLIADAATRHMPDVVAFAWWCRKANIERLAASYDDGALRLGRGLAFHVTPTNMPVNFAFSWVFSLLAGNANIVRIPNRDFEQIPFLLRHIREIFAAGSFSDIGKMNAFVAYKRQEEITEALSEISDVRIVWGGDATIRMIRKAPLPARGIDIGFADRYSFCIMEAVQILKLDAVERMRVVNAFFNDAYIMDQNACSSPRLVVWRGSEAEAVRAQKLFWSTLGAELKKRYHLSDLGSMNKLVQACRDAIEMENLTGLEREDNRVYRLRLDALPAAIDTRRCGGGYFYEYVTADLNSIAAIVTSKYQTLTYYGIDKKELAEFVISNRLAGIDRIVPVGQAMDIGLIWDGYDLMSTLSRVCDVR